MQDAILRSGVPRYMHISSTVRSQSSFFKLRHFIYFDRHKSAMLVLCILAHGTHFRTLSCGEISKKENKFFVKTSSIVTKHAYYVVGLRRNSWHFLSSDKIRLHILFLLFKHVKIFKIWSRWKKMPIIPLQLCAQ